MVTVSPSGACTHVVSQDALPLPFVTTVAPFHALVDVARTVPLLSMQA